MQVVIEARCGHFLGHEGAAVLQAPVHQQNVEAAARQIRAEHQAVVAGADDDPVVAPVQRRRHIRSLTFSVQGSIKPATSQHGFCFIRLP
jgi:hypothetical protein